MTRRIGALALAFVGGLIVMLVVGGVGLPGLPDFRTVTKDRSQPAVLRSIEKLSEYHPATANLEVVVDLEKDVKYVPGFLKGERGLYLAVGKVDAIIDFSNLNKNAVLVSEDRTSVSMTLPAPTLGDAQVDPARSRLYNRQRGILDRIESLFEDSPTSERDFVLSAQDKLEDAARADGGVLDSAETNTRSMLEGLMKALGFTDVKVNFAKPAKATKA